MIEASAIVVAVEPGLAWVETVRQSACGHCHSAASCGTSALAKVFGARRSRLRVEDAVGVQVGEQVVIGIPDATLVRASLVAYLLPLLFLITGAALATRFALGDGLAALAGISALGVGLWLSGRLTGGRAARARYRPVLVGRRGLPASGARDPDRS